MEVSLHVNNSGILCRGRVAGPDADRGERGSRLKLLTFTAPAEAGGKLRFQRLEIGDVLRSTDGALIWHEELFAEEAHRQVVEWALIFSENASSTSTPLLLVRRSMRFGGRPS
ncbi:MAG: hypothetical protein M3453_15410 [Pseudomonadota bacterium]|nr:hypothetical protein [Pseudomonadota bacterium]